MAQNRPKVFKLVQNYPKMVKEKTKLFNIVQLVVNSPKWSKFVKMDHMVQYGPKWSKMALIVKTYTKLSKMVQYVKKLSKNGRKWFKSVQIVLNIQHFQNYLKWSDIVENGSKFSKKFKMFQNCSFFKGLIWSKFI